MIGRLYIGASVLGALVVGALGVLLGAERIDGDGTLLDTDVISQLFAGYRVGLVFAVAVPLFLGIALFIVPLQVGARSLAFPRAAAAGFWAWFGGIVLVVVALFNNGGPFGGSHDMVGLYLAAYALMMVGLTASAGSVAASVLSTRPGMRMPRMPLFAWSALVWAIGLVLVLPVLVGVLIYLFVDYRYAGGSLFSGASGISAWTEFVITGPVLALFAVPAVGLLAELIPVTFRKRLPMRGVAFTGLALVALGLLAGVAQQPVAPAPWTDTALTRHNYATKLGDIATYAMFVVLPLLGVLIVFAVGALAGKPERRANTRPCSPAERHRAARVRRARGDAGGARHDRQPAGAVHRPRPAGHGVRGGSHGRRGLRRPARRPRRRRLLDPEGHRRPAPRRTLVRARRARSARCPARVGAVRHRRLSRSARLRRGLEQRRPG